MQHLITTLLLFCALCSNAQSGEFTVYSNGLIYDNNTMGQLTHIVDSLNLKFKRCDLTKQYYAKSQAIGRYITMDTGNMKAAYEDIKNNISFEDFNMKYKEADDKNEILIVKFRYQDSYSKKWKVVFSGEAMYELINPEIYVHDDPSIYDRSMKGKWLAKYYDSSNYSKESLCAFYFTTEFRAEPVPDKYARMILYSDCLVDTTVDIFKANAQDDGTYYSL